MTATLQLLSPDNLMDVFFRQSAGCWSSERRYYTLPDGKTQEMKSAIEITFLEQGCEELRELARLHELEDESLMVCGAKVTWDTQNSILGKQMSHGVTSFGVVDGVMYRDRGFATGKPVTASFSFTNPETLCLRTEYDGSVFEEEIRLVGSRYRTRQTVMTRAGEQKMIGQYLEKRVE
ncbi:phycobiliprotein lyase [filamentous cyanobacterium LEGE 11480]|uniref:Chromophore lyase CpcS/CpeS n=1 Tax=Romeriopsis navalis LEGE 11480 TaxID=2777977 RepID=A0A928VTH6_9CYAN|nr:phycobiliprotein lyase [Romeriopsis navalis]MBE9033443.1 phycobiliprotein lyase [Romeriopsis navalis LEGE 11480]